MTKPHSDCSGKKRTTEFVAEILAMIENNPSKVKVSYQLGGA